MSSKKAIRKGDTPAKIVKNSINVYLSELRFLISNCLKKGIFPDDLKLANITPIFEREDSVNKENYRTATYCLICQKCLKGLSTKKLTVLQRASFHLTYATLEKITMLNILL